MRSLEIRTERIFNNLIKENQKLAADFVLKQSKSVSSAQSPMSSVKSPEFSAQSQHPASRVQRPGSEFSVQSTTSRVQRPDTSVQSPASRVQRPTLASRAQEFRYAHFRWTSTKVIPIKKLKLATFRRWAKGSREAASEGPTVLHICFCSLSNIRFIEIQSNLGRKKLHRTN